MEIMKKIILTVFGLGLLMYSTPGTMGQIHNTSSNNGSGSSSNSCSISLINDLQACLNAIGSDDDDDDGDDGGSSGSSATASFQVVNGSGSSLYIYATGSYNSSQLSSCMANYNSNKSSCPSAPNLIKKNSKAR